MAHRFFSRRPALATVLTMGVLSAAAAGCSGDATASGKATPEPTQHSVVVSQAPKTDLHVELAEWTVTPNVTRLAAGTLRVSATNTGARPHDLVVIKVDDPKVALPVKEGSVDETKVAIVDRFREFKSGEKEKSITLTPGEYLLTCNIEGHYEQGMTTAISVR